MNDSANSVASGGTFSDAADDAYYAAMREALDEWNLDNWPPTEEERGVDWGRE